MFDGDQFHQFIASTTSLPIPLYGTPSFPAFDPFPSHHQPVYAHQTVNQQHQSATKKDVVKQDAQKQDDEQTGLTTNLVLERGTSRAEPVTDPWSSDEVLALFSIRSSLDNWFPDFTWEHVSRKLAELGFKRSAEKCKHKFQEESRHFNSISQTKNYRIFGDLDEFYHGGEKQNQGSAEKDQKNEKQAEEKEAEGDKASDNLEEEDENVAEDGPSQETEEKAGNRGKKRKRKGKFDMFKGFCEAVVNKIMAQQEELHIKLIQDMVKRDKEKIAREEAWKNQEMDRINKDIEIRVREQATAQERQTTIINFLKNFSSDDGDGNFEKKIEDLLKVYTSSSSPNSPGIVQVPANENYVETSTSSSMVVTPQSPSAFLAPKSVHLPQVPCHSTPTSTQAINSSMTNSVLAPTQNPNSPTTKENGLSFSPPVTINPAGHLHPTTSSEKGDTGNRWPREEVLALIDLRCKLNNNAVDDNKEGAKGPLWERISQGMMELGYKRSAKRCKEKWENINKYFRKTKDSNKKRSVDSRTCPYFHQLSHLYNQGTLVGPSNEAENH